MKNGPIWNANETDNQVCNIEKKGLGLENNFKQSYRPKTEYLFNFLGLLFNHSTIFLIFLNYYLTANFC